MSRRRRLQFAGAVYHVTTRGNRKAVVFDDDLDRRAFMRTLVRAITRYGIRCFAYCLMGNHYHLVFDTPRGNLSETVRYINGVYAQYSNRRHERGGHVWERRFRSLVVQREGYLRRACRYVVLNPVRAGLVDCAEQWTWSSYRATAGLQPAPEWLHTGWLDEAFRATDAEARRFYCAFVNDPVERKSRIDVTALAHGDQQFEVAISELAKKVASDRVLNRFVMPLTRPSLPDVLGGATTRGPARDQAIEIAHVAYGYRQSEIAAYLNLHQSNISRALRRRLPSVNDS